MIDYIFRQYDIRGKIGSELAVDEVYDLTKAIAYYFLQKNPAIKTVAVGADGRTHSPAIKEQMCKALQDSGLNVVFVGVCPTPILYFSLFTLSVDAGLMITASHNGKEYNGIKICLEKNSVWGESIQEIKELAKKGRGINADSRGTYREEPVIDHYLGWTEKHFPHLIGMDISAVIDCGNGAAGTVLPQLIERMQWKNVQLLYAEVDGTYPNHEADPIVEENMADVKHILQTTDAVIGIGMDGDCDRMAPMTKEGELVMGDKLLAVFAQDMLKDHPGATVVFDIKCSSGLPEVLEQWQANPVMSASGHSIIKNKIKEKGAKLAGELSCHFFFNDRYFGYDDAIYAALRLFELLQKTGKSLHKLLSVFPPRVSTKEFRVACKEEDKARIVSDITHYFIQQPRYKVVTIDGVRASTSFGWGMVRASNTQPVLCIRFEADSEKNLDTIRNEFISVMSPHFATGFIHEQLC